MSWELDREHDDIGALDRRDVVGRGLHAVALVQLGGAFSRATSR